MVGTMPSRVKRSNPRHERFAQALFAALLGETRVARAQSTAYLEAYPNCTEGNSAEAAASRLLRRGKAIAVRVAELQAQALAKIERKLDVSRERVGKRLDMASRIAEAQGKAADIVAAEAQIAKVFGLAKASDQYNPVDFNSAKSMNDIGRLLMQSVGASSPSQTQINLAVEANNAFVARLESIASQALPHSD